MFKKLAFVIKPNKCYICDNTLLSYSQTHNTRCPYQLQLATKVFNEDSAAVAAMTLQEWQHAKPFNEMPTMSPWRMVCNLLPGGKYSQLDSSQLMLSFKDDMGHIIRFKGLFGGPDIVITHNPQDFRKALSNSGNWPARPGMEFLLYHRNKLRADFFQGVEGLIPTQGEKWGNFRTIVNPVLMQPRNVRWYFRKMSAVNKELVARIRDIRDPNSLEVPHNFEDYINRFTLESVSVVALDKQLGLLRKHSDNESAKELLTSLTILFTYAMVYEFGPSTWKYYQTATFKKLMSALDSITDITTAFIDEAIARIEEDRRNGIKDRTENEKSVIEKLIKIDRRVAVVMAIDMLMAGVDTAASALAGILLCLAKNPEKQAKLREEVMTILPYKNSDFTESNIKNMPYVRACIREAMRMYPLLVGNARGQFEDIVLSGYRVPKGTLVYTIYTSLLRDDKYFLRANEYLPERWLRPTKDMERNDGTMESPHALRVSDPFVFLPFGYGSRSCIGRRVLEMELHLAIARLIRNFNVEFNYSTEKAFKSYLINVPNIPLKFKFTDVEI